MPRLTISTARGTVEIPDPPAGIWDQIAEHLDALAQSLRLPNGFERSMP